MSTITIISDIPDEIGWSTIRRMVSLLGRTFQAEIEDISSLNPGRLQRFLHSRSPRSRARGDGIAICIARVSFDGRRFVPALRAGGYSRVVLWNIDSFWTEPVDRELDFLRRHFDLIVHMKRFDEEFYRQRFGNRALCLEWGSDALDLGTHNPDRPCDLLRVGRQPQGWESDEETARAAAALGLNFRGRPGPGASPSDAIFSLMRDHYSRAKFVLAHTNVAAPSQHTHPTKAYITGRWTDSLAAGATIAGMPPEGDLHLLDWPEALLKFPDLDRDTGLHLVAEAVASWTPEVARRNHLGALRRLDWRWRFRALADALGLSVPLLDEEIERLEARIALLSGEAPRVGEPAMTA